ncbi:glycine--tRNA ligase subunit beta [Listeria newyorkensis]|uniref:Glycine--tRNA ligase beta subunit n=1 Tax=Listeria newyorkensis TaxID=1497681 RepID=A0ABX4XQE0_9LIST|nr:glycine--tRNA ligase subunit beta [Listeria newyorkensis]KGL40214.1 glycine-tRNA synthetase subunit beta [Listeria newyorkensis]PNP93490.1 glycine--tRNA ligase subunit beta [Listeria newyorkensis]WAO21059.1 glycine--tRNA ligase subunit beta [Listeria newyorkensis]SQC55953.1 Glycine--tRNA ligase beta subunit [Listeria newyorkensis]
MSKDFLLEIGLEEMPAKYITASVKQLQERVEKWLAENDLEYKTTEVYSSPRRLSVIVKDLAEKQADRVEESKGPAKKIAKDAEGNWSKAAQGFARGQGVDPDTLEFREINGVEYIYLEKEVKGAATVDLLPEMRQIVTSMTFPVSMHWAAYDLKYIRPIKWLIALFGDQVIPFEITNVPTGNETRGHRFLGGSVAISNPAEYEEALLSQFVVADAAKRKAAIVSQIEEIEAVENWKIPVDAGLLEEVNNLVEYPTVLHATFDEAYLELPEEVLITTMKEHQRYFPVVDEAGKLRPYFITVRNGNHEHLETVAKGNEKVLRARLSDADFFYQEDLKITIDEAVAKLNNIVFHEKLGTLTEKMVRVKKVALIIAEQLNMTEAQKGKIARVADIYKFDLVTNLVGEFPELQGIMGEKYALLQGEDAEVATAIREHYMPTSADGELPQSDIGALLAVADKLETLTGFFCVNIVPTGSADPFSLRRSALGIMRIIQAKNWDIRLLSVLADTVEIERAEGLNTIPSEEVFEQVELFLQNRLRAILSDQQIRHDIIDAVVSAGSNVVPELIERAELLNKNRDAEWFRPTMEALARVVNISKKHQGGDITIDPGLFENESEQQLFDAVQKLKQDYPTLIIVDRLRAFAALRTAIDAYFENTLVMSDDEAVRNNRLALLFELASFIKEFAQIEEINVK